MILDTSLSDSTTCVSVEISDNVSTAESSSTGNVSTYNAVSAAYVTTADCSSKGNNVTIIEIKKSTCLKKWTKI